MNEEIINNEDKQPFLEQIIHVIWKNKILIGIISIIIIIVGVVYTFGIVDSTYESSSQIVVQVSTDSGSGDNADVTTGQKLITTIAELVECDTVLNKVKEKEEYKNYSLSELREFIEVSYSTNSFIITVSCETNDSNLSRDLTNEVVDSLVIISKTSDFTFINDLIVKISDAETGEYASPNKVLYLLITIIAAIFVSIAVAFIKELFQTKIIEPKEVESLLNLNVIGSQIDDKSFDNKNSNLSYSQINKDNYDKLLTNIDFSNVDNCLKIIGITSSSQGEGKSSTLFNLANTISNSHKKCLVIDLDLRAGRLHRYFGVSNENGIATYATNQCEKKDIIKKYNENVDVITSGGTSPNPLNILQSKLLINLLDELRDQYDYILVDSPTVFIGSDVLVISKICDGMIFGVSSNLTKIKLAKDAIYELKKTNVKIIGVNVNHLKQANKYYYNYQYRNK